MRELRLAPLAEFADVTMGQSPDAAACNTEERGLPFLQGCAEFGATHPDTNIYCAPPLRVAKSGSVLISVRAPVGTMNYADQDYCVGRGLGAFKAKPGLANTIFLKHAVELNSGYLHRRSQGSTFAAVSTTDVRSVPVPAFSPQVQGRIASILTSIDTAIEKTETLIAKHQQIKAGLMHDLFTRGVLPNGQLRPPRNEAPELYQETALGWIPHEWRVVALNECLSRTPKNGYSPRECDTWEGFYVLGLGCLTKEGFEARQLKSAPRAAAQQSDALLETGDLLISRANTPELVGLCGVFPGLDSPTIYPDLMMRLTLHPAMDKHFLETQLLLPQTRSRLTALAVGTSSSMAKLNAASINKFPVLLPSVEEQRLIMNRSKVIVTAIQSGKTALGKLRLQKLGLMRDLLSCRVPVPAAAEPAEAAA